MAKKRRRRKASLLTKAINVGVLLLAFSRPIQLLTTAGPDAARRIVIEATAGLVKPGGQGKFDQNVALGFYGPMVAAIALKKAISMVRRTARV